MNTKPYQVARSTDKSLVHRKWNHLGTFHAFSFRSAAYMVAVQCGLKGDIVAEHCGPGGAIFEFPGNEFLCVN